MMRKQAFLLLTLSYFLAFAHMQAAQNYSIAFVHIGTKLPAHLPDTLYQARLFNQDCKIFLLANQSALNAFDNTANLSITTIPLESLTPTEHHKKFTAQTAWEKGFWRYASERFLYLDDFMQKTDEKNIFHLESDVALYVNLAELMPVFLEHYKGIGGIFENDDRCCPCFMYIENKSAMDKIAECFARYARTRQCDMTVLGLFKNETKNVVSALPIIMDSYRDKHPLINSRGQTTKRPEDYSNNLAAFNSVFDGLALGQYLGGLDPIHKDCAPGFIDQYCLFSAKNLNFTWQTDGLGRKIPYMVFGDEMYPIINLHIHCKNLKPFLSKNIAA